MHREAKRVLVIDLPLPAACRPGRSSTPAVFEIASLDVLKQEVFGPILHVVRYGQGQLGKVIATRSTPAASA